METTDGETLDRTTPVEAAPVETATQAEMVQLLLRLASGDLTGRDRQVLAADLTTTPWQVAAFGITAGTLNGILDRRIQHFQSLYPLLQPLCQLHLGQDCSMSTLWKLWLPLAEQLVIWQQTLQRPLIQGILGGQGTGKTTLTLILTAILQQFGLPVARLSIDDLYKTYQERQELQILDPRFRWRGPPGTHDVALGLQTLTQLRQSTEQPVPLPRFDKSAHGGAGDRTAPEWVMGAKIILFEGWFVGVQPIAPQSFETAPLPITTEADRNFARTVNAQLQAYLPLWQQLDHLIVLYPTDYRLSQQWRRQAERQQIATGRGGMGDIEINQFVEYFWCALHPELFIRPLLASERVDLVVEINAAHQPITLYRPGVYSNSEQ